VLENVSITGKYLVTASTTVRELDVLLVLLLVNMTCQMMGFNSWQAIKSHTADFAAKTGLFAQVSLYVLN